MKIRSTLRAGRLCIMALTLLSASAACDAFDRLSGGYVGPMPDDDPITSEAVTVASTYTAPGGHIRFVLDRTRYVDAGDPHDVNRVIEAMTTPENQAAVAALNLQRGDRVVISTEFIQIGEGGGSMNVPNWPGHDAMEYPIGLHRITTLQRAAP